ncbi:response regulator transcription factor [Pedobacter caeni]|uniref:Phosphate regulon transcriptional regulatory protein PhoB n=1 Tax=Pedobacter caeni TaxID=288992 RepID=A0A1M4UCP6_9SPHI|nr:response regulator transcription factor [Pedobacter caeni]SHE54562.1 DNA-binding response regulator, OmpR family, contains REC and winged-helix (wHTH) domain [Pedobacter caeni]
MESHILLVEDDEEISRLIGISLRNENYKVSSVSNSKDSYAVLEQQAVDLLLLDIMLPGEDGIAMCREIREKYTMPIIFLTAKTGEIDKIKGFSVGADDYITKPFSAVELIARVKAHLRRHHQYSILSNDPIVKIDSLTIDKRSHQVELDGNMIKLTPKEYEILELLATHKGKVFSISKIYESIWKTNYLPADNSVMVHIANLRQKLEPGTKHPRFIKTIWGFGYKI